MKIDLNNEKAEFACKVCLEQMRRSRSNSFVECFYRRFNNEYCVVLANCLEGEACDETKSD